MSRQPELTFTSERKKQNNVTNLKTQNQSTSSNTSQPLTLSQQSPTSPTSPASGLGRMSALAANATSVVDNVLHKFASYNYIITFAALTKAQVNKNSLLTISEIKNIISKTGGDWGNGGNRAELTAIGKFDYFIDDLNIETIYGFPDRLGNSFASKISFKVTEPYSMGLFITAMQAASLNSGYQNYRDAPYVLCIEFKGWDDQGNAINDSSTTRIIPIMITNLTFTVNQGGAIYSVEAIPYQEIAYTDNYALAFKDVQVTGQTVQDLFSSLETHLLTRLKEVKKDLKMSSIDEVFIEAANEFQNQPGFNAGPIWTARTFTDLSDAGQREMPDVNEVIDPVREIYLLKKIPVKKINNIFHFKQDAKIQDIINEIVIRSDYIKNQIKDGKFSIDDNGMVKWWRVEVFVEDLDFNKKLNRNNRRITFRVVPYMVHVNRLLPPGVSSPKLPELTSNISKLYNYIYTGKNTDVLTFNIEYKFALFHDLSSDLTNNTRTNHPSLSATAGSKDPLFLHYDSQLVNTQTSEPYRQSVFSRTASDITSNNGYGGSGSDDPITVQIKTLKKILENPLEMMNIDLEIMGDPYYIPNSGMGNQIGAEAGLNIMNDGSLNYQNGEVHFMIVFRTPIDLDLQTGLYRFDASVDTFSGLYHLISGECRFNQGKFTNLLRAYRLNAQETTSSATDAATSVVPNGTTAWVSFPFGYSTTTT
jgi:hypothetical protein